MNTPRIKDAPELGEVVKGLAGRMGDANINCVIGAAQCLEMMAKGLMASFAKYRETVVPPMLERLKERKVTVTDAIGQSLDAVFSTVCMTYFALHSDSDTRFRQLYLTFYLTSCQHSHQRIRK
jgi:cytoskeleton-associated protein 5